MTVQIVGVVTNVGYSDVKDPVPAVFYAPWHQDSRSNYMNFYARTDLPPEQLINSIREVLKRIEPAMPVEDLKTMEQQIRENVFLDRMISILSAAFAVLALGPAIGIAAMRRLRARPEAARMASGQR